MESELHEGWAAPKNNYRIPTNGSYHQGCLISSNNVTHYQFSICLNEPKILSQCTEAIFSEHIDISNVLITEGKPGLGKNSLIDFITCRKIEQTRALLCEDKNKIIG